MERWKAVSNTATWGMAGARRSMASIPSRLAGLCSGASTAILRMAALTSGVTMALSSNSVPPCTTRWPAMSIVESLSITRVWPLHSIWSIRSITADRSSVDKLSSTVAPPEVATLRSVVPGWCVQSASACQSGAGARSGNLSTISYRRLFWLLEPAFNTRTRIMFASFHKFLHICSDATNRVGFLKARRTPQKEFYEKSPYHRRQASITKKSLPEPFNSKFTFRSLLTPFELAPPARAVIGDNGFKKVQQGARVDGFV